MKIRKTYDAADLETPVFSKNANLFWKIYSAFMIPLNIVIMLYMFGIIVASGFPAINDWQRGLWLSQYIGLFCCYLVLSGFKNEDLNGFYMFVFIFPHLAFYSSGDIFSFLNHFPHFLGWYVMFNPKIKASRRGIFAGFGFIMIWLTMCFVLQYPDGMAANANNISDKLFPVILGGGIVWLLFVNYTWMKKQQKIRTIMKIPDENWVWEQDLTHVLPRHRLYPPNANLWRLPRYFRLIGITLGVLFGVFIVLEISAQGWLSVFWISNFTILSGISMIYHLCNKPSTNEKVLYLIPFAFIELLIRFGRNDRHAIISIIFLIIILILLIVGIKKRNLSKFMAVDQIGLGIGFFAQGILYLLTFSLSYHQNIMDLGINFGTTSLPLIFLMFGLFWIIFLYFYKKKKNVI